MFLCKKMVVLSGEMSGFVKIERLGDNVTCATSLMTAKDDMALGIKLGAKPIEYFMAQSTKGLYRMKGNADLTGAIACVILDKSSGRIIASGSLGKCDILQVASELSLALRVSNTPNIATNRENTSISPNKTTVDNTIERLSPLDKARVIDSRKGESSQNNSKSYGEREKDKASDNRVTDSFESDKDIIIEPTAVIPAVASQKVLSEAPREVIDVDDVEESGYFYEKVKDRLHELFTRYPHDSALESVVHSSQWVRVDYDDSNYYVVGIIEEEGKPLFICYGVPVDSKLIKAEDKQSNSEWLPLDHNNSDGKGYWVLYQDARTGETLS